MKQYLLPLVAFILALSACKKDDSNLTTVPVEEVKDDNQISVVVRESYVNRMYIDLLGRKPDETELAQALNLLKLNNSSIAQRTKVVDIILAQPEYYDRLYVFNKQQYLNGAEEGELERGYTTAMNQYNTAKQQGNEALAAVLLARAEAYTLLLSIPDDLKSGTITDQEMHMRMVENQIYDQINMGVANFTFAVFESFLFRAPTESEWDNAQRMCNGQSKTLFGRSGSNKHDFVVIVFNSDHYWEGRVIDAYLRFVNRQPATVELYEKTVDIKQTEDFKALFKSILISDEYFGV